MTSISSYLTFNSNCREAMTFYKKCLGGILTFQTINGSSFSDKMPDKMKNTIIHATLVKDKLVLMASGIVDENGLKRGNTISLMLHCNSKEETQEYYEKLSFGEKNISFNNYILGSFVW